ncbi:Hypothetical protein R9X50_00197000 [Acrodontium crateriforme]|uniref:Uncharacterized protein n=1 Tax=Acrodontium crateriforme TaxID=150365 RepID=A0AAQ3R8L8_9PEZI|nr:Hypothetical protein R9X50_00197000 [Acrodontium crateriforme]
MHDPPGRRQLWGPPTSTVSTDSTASYCTAFVLPSNGVLSLADALITLTTNVVFQPSCTGNPSDSGSTGSGVSSTDAEAQPFYASTIPQTYVIAAATVIAWILLIMLIITPRSSSIVGLSPGFSSGRGIIGGASGGNANLIGVGSRPWLQKAAALTVAVALTIATADTMKQANKQYVRGHLDSDELRRNVLYSLEIRIVRVISDVFVWLAQVQTLIRLFPRHKEKVLIKWIGFALIVFDSTFSCLNAFLAGKPKGPSGQFYDFIPAISYLFELALGLLYAAWVLYYVLTKRRYAFYHSKMRNISLIAFISIIAILTPVVFFVTDVLNQDVGGWGDYFRWVGATAASVVVWEWVERIEALERDEKKDGILGVEVFDGDEMLQVTPTNDMIWSGSRSDRKHVRKSAGVGGSSDAGENKTSAFDQLGLAVANRFRPKYSQNARSQVAPHFPLGRAHSATTTTTTGGRRAISFGNTPRPKGDRANQTTLGYPTPPPPVASPINRAENTSGASTVYVVHYDNADANAPEPVRRSDVYTSTVLPPDINEKEELSEKEDEPNLIRSQEPNKYGWNVVTNPFKRKRTSPPAVIQQATRQTFEATTTGRATTPSAQPSSRWDLRNRIAARGLQVGLRRRERSMAGAQGNDPPLTVIPARSRETSRMWSTAALGQQQHREESRAVYHSTTADMSQSISDIRISGSTTQVASNSNNSSNETSPATRAMRSDRLLPQTRSSDLSIHQYPAQHRPTTMARGLSWQDQRAASTTPPRADDLTPIPDGNEPLIVPAPQRRSPLRSSTPATSDSTRR